MLKIVAVVAVVDIINAFLVQRRAKRKGLNHQEWFVLSLPLFVLAWLAISKQPQGQSENTTPVTAPAASISPPAPADAALGEFRAPFLQASIADDAPGTLAKPEEISGVSLAEFKPKSEITDRDYASTRTKTLEAAPSASASASARRVKKRKRKKNPELKVMDEDMVRCPNCSHQVYPNQFGLCPYCGVRLK